MPRSQSETATLWAQRLQRFAQVQMTVAQFCATEQVAPSAFYRWKRKLRAEPSVNASAAAKFLPVAFAAKPECHDTPTALAKTTIELPGGVRICVEVPTQSDPTQARQVQA